MEGWSFYTSDELKARGWLRRQLALQAAGLCGNLDKIWPDVQRSAWIGGDREGWERVPYWLDGFVPLAYLLEDADMIARARRYIDAILRALEPFGIKELAQSGMVAIGRGGKSITERVLRG